MLRALFSERSGVEDDSDAGILESQIPILENVLNGTGTDVPAAYHTPGTSDMHGYEFQENDWTKRLCGGLQVMLGRDVVTYIAEDSYRFLFKIVQSARTGLPSEHATCYPFKGSPDITLQGRALIETEASSLEEPSSSSEEESIEFKRQRSEIALYPAKLGEILA